MLLVYVTVVLFFLLFGGLSHVKAGEWSLSGKLQSVLPVTAQKIIGARSEMDLSVILKKGDQ